MEWVCLAFGNSMRELQLGVHTRKRKRIRLIGGPAPGCTWRPGWQLCRVFRCSSQPTKGWRKGCSIQRCGIIKCTAPHSAHPEKWAWNGLSSFKDAGCCGNAAQGRCQIKPRFRLADDGGVFLLAPLGHQGLVLHRDDLFALGEGYRPKNGTAIRCRAPIMETAKLASGATVLDPQELITFRGDVRCHRSPRSVTTAAHAPTLGQIAATAASAAATRASVTSTAFSARNRCRMRRAFGS